MCCRWWEEPECDPYCSPDLSEYVEHVCNWSGFLRSAVVWGWTDQMQPAIHALRAAADSGVRYDGVHDYAASLSLPWVDNRAAEWSVQHRFSSLHAN